MNYLWTMSTGLRLLGASHLLRPDPDGKEHPFREDDDGGVAAAIFDEEHRGDVLYRTHDVDTAVRPKLFQWNKGRKKAENLRVVPGERLSMLAFYLAEPRELVDDVVDEDDGSW